MKTLNGELVAAKYRPRIVRKGIAKELDLKVSGRRNMLGACVSRRRCEWFAPTSKFMAYVTKSNTNVQCPYRLPLNETTHGEDCRKEKCRNAS